MADTQVPQEYLDYINQLSSALVNSTGEVKYNPQSISTLKSALSKTMRPSYDREIDTLKQNVKTNSANIDADAAARGMGSSSWVTDAKMKQQNAMNKNIRGVESDYNSALYNALLSRLNNQDELGLSAQQANTSIKANAISNSMSPAWELYQQNKTASSGGGGSYRGGSGSPKTSSDGDEYTPPITDTSTKTATGTQRQYGSAAKSNSQTAGTTSIRALSPTTTLNSSTQKKYSASKKKTTR